MKKMYVILSILMFIGFSLHADFSYRLAVSEDVDQLCELYRQFTEDDKNKLLVFLPEIQRLQIEEHVEKKHLFVACEKKTGKIVSFLKLYVVDSEEIDDMLNGELNLGSS